MRYAVIVGFEYALEVYAKLKFYELFEAGRIVWIPPALADERQLRDLLLRLVQQRDLVCVIAARPCTKPLQPIVDEVNAVCGAHSVSFIKDLNPRKRYLRRAIETFLEAHAGPSILSSTVQRMIGEKPLLCVRSRTEPSFVATLTASGLPYSGISVKERSFHFLDKGLLISLVRSSSAECGRLLYASSGIGTLERTTVSRWEGRLHLGRHPVDATQSLYKYLVADQNRSEIQSAQEGYSLISPETSQCPPGYRLAIRAEPLVGISGDVLLIEPLTEGRVAIAVADVTGKGAGPGFLGANTQGILKALALDGGLPHEVCSRVNRMLSQNMDQRKFTTLFYAELNGTSHDLKYCNAGHPPPIVCRSDGSTAVLESHGSPLGMIPNAAYSQSVLTFGRGDRLVVYTDGVTEASNAKEEQFGEDGLHRILNRLGAEGPEEIAAAILDEASEFCSDHFQDDVTILVIARDD